MLLNFSIQPSMFKTGVNDLCYSPVFLCLFRIHSYSVAMVRNALTVIS